MATVSVNPPKTPVTTGSNGVAVATVPNVCKMPGPPAPFVPTPLPNIGKSSSSPEKYTKDVKVEKKPVAVKGASFASQGDMGSKGTGGGLVSSNTHGFTKFVGPGSLDVKFEGKNVQLLGDPMMNDCGPSGSPANSATLAGVMQLIAAVMFPEQAGDKGPTECTSGASHDWRCREAKGSKGMRQKIHEAAANRRRGTRFEATAAAHNQAAGELIRPSQLSGNPHGEKVMWVCTICGLDREGDQIHDGLNGGSPRAVEVKCKKALDIKDAKQLGRNLQAVRQGGASGLIYKVPANAGGNFLSRQIEQLGEMAGVAIRVIRI